MASVRQSRKETLVEKAPSSGLYVCTLLYLPEFSPLERDLIETEKYLNNELIVIVTVRLNVSVNLLLGEQ